MPRETKKRPGVSHTPLLALLLLLVMAEMWPSLGVAQGPSKPFLVKDINPAGDNTIKYLTGMSGNAFFAADDLTHGAELWKSYGTAAGTVLLLNIYPNS